MKKSRYRRRSKIGVSQHVSGSVVTSPGIQPDRPSYCGHELLSHVVSGVAIKDEVLQPNANSVDTFAQTFRKGVGSAIGGTFKPQQLPDRPCQRQKVSHSTGNSYKSRQHHNFPRQRSPSHQATMAANIRLSPYRQGPAVTPVSQPYHNSAYSGLGEMYVYPQPSEHIRIHVTTIMPPTHGDASQYHSQNNNNNHATSQSFIAIIPWAATIDDIEHSLLSPLVTGISSKHHVRHQNQWEIIVRLRTGEFVTLDDVADLQFVEGLIVRIKPKGRARPAAVIPRNGFWSGVNQDFAGDDGLELEGPDEMGRNEKSRKSGGKSKRRGRQRKVPAWMRFATAGIGRPAADVSGAAKNGSGNQDHW